MNFNELLLLAPQQILLLLLLFQSSFLYVSDWLGTGNWRNHLFDRRWSLRCNSLSIPFPSLNPDVLNHALSGTWSEESEVRSHIQFDCNYLSARHMLTGFKSEYDTGYAYDRLHVIADRYWIHRFYCTLLKVLLTVSCTRCLIS